MNGARAAVAHVHVVFEGVVAATQHGHGQAGVVLRHDGRTRADQHAGPRCARRMIRQPLGAHPGGDDQRAGPHLGLVPGPTRKRGFDPALAGPDRGHAGFQPQGHAGRAHAGVDVGRHLLAGHAGQHGDPVVGERIVIAQAAQAGAGLDQQRGQAQARQPEGAGGAGRAAAYNDRIVHLLHFTPY
ncbi:hypothetical protein D3C72_1553880 [compost metagenome]